MLDCRCRQCSVRNHSCGSPSDNAVQEHPKTVADNCVLEGAHAENETADMFGSGMDTILGIVTGNESADIGVLRSSQPQGDSNITTNQEATQKYHEVYDPSSDIDIRDKTCSDGIVRLSVKEEEGTEASLGPACEMLSDDPQNQGITRSGKPYGGQ